MRLKHRFDKIIRLKSHETVSARQAYDQAVEMFRIEGTALYHLLKEKEAVETELGEVLKKGCTLLHIQSSQAFLGQLSEEVARKQHQVADARNVMQAKQEVLLLKNIEQKKYEHLKDVQTQKEKELHQAEEAKMLDEVSIQQHQKNGAQV
ncbi:flagellar export protein FliJ [Aureibacillus halotolerans]|uniref:Flagellar FliJ protein n=1 Tax=Aureibacillus halotolerans TaxID=1508390 RepID=A0A4R6U501_9BACI|nr:flagellar export protein FliJ [Aureibacillus halotolerans]TDQ39649.1 flagellar export protein FliJ [Aureibacillus halotolerans]